MVTGGTGRYTDYLSKVGGRGTVLVFLVPEGQDPRGQARAPWALAPCLCWEVGAHCVLSRRKARQPPPEAVSGLPGCPVEVSCAWAASGFWPLCRPGRESGSDTCSEAWLLGALWCGPPPPPPPRRHGGRGGPPPPRGGPGLGGAGPRPGGGGRGGPSRCPPPPAPQQQAGELSWPRPLWRGFWLGAGSSGRGCGRFETLFPEEEQDRLLEPLTPQPSHGPPR